MDRTQDVAAALQWPEVGAEKTVTRQREEDDCIVEETVKEIMISRRVLRRRV